MITSIVCPCCQTSIDVEAFLVEQITQKLTADQLAEKQKQQTLLRQKEEELTKRAAQVEEQKAHLEQELSIREKELSHRLTLRIQAEVEKDQAHKLQMLTADLQRKQTTIRQLEIKEMEYLQKEQQLQEREAALENEVSRKLLAERRKIEDEARRKEEENQYLKLQEREHMIVSLKGQLEDMKRKIEQGSVQQQGEVLELVLENMLKESFPHDVIEEIGKGILGGDIVQTVNTPFGKSCGILLFESKRTKQFDHKWLGKLKEDLMRKKGDIAILVTEAMPKGMTEAGMVEGVWVCSFREVRPLVMALRNGLIRLAEVKLSEENKGEKMQMLYQYLTSEEFRQQFQNLFEVYQTMQEELDKERRQLQTAWAKREKQIQRLTACALSIHGSIQGIAGREIPDVVNLALEAGSLLDQNDAA
ncbi:DUF2130 domain-containing protein [Xanthocytophaga flava]|uniref:DUF2130 domain-containing protein n=1 Tax=Xanthocytophaga flava TaxID=3048013 RepID=UPI0028D69858|nr:DUF2130 domain-containing protein [Xanthocytophaga flavus]MDJ1466194.1 DUF2130 domain-containing protein [Xanthocytophaga flavus]